MTDIGFDRVYDLLNRAARLMTPTGYGDFLTFIGNRVGTLGESYGRDVPPERNLPLPAFYERTGKNGRAYKSKFKSRKQQGYVFAQIAKGKIPYRRSGLLPASITHWVQLSGNRLSVYVGTNRKGAKYVIGGEGEQSHYMAARGWFQLPRRIDEHAADLRNEAQSAATDYLRGYLSGRR